MAALNFVGAMHYVVQGWRLVRRPGLRRFVWIPLIINILVFAGLGWLFFSAVADWFANITFLHRLQEIPLIGWVFTLLQWLFGAVVIVLMLFFFSLLANLIGAPFNGLLSERTEQYLNGKLHDNESTLQSLIKTIPSTLSSELRKLLYLVLWLVPLFIAHWIPGLNLIAPFLLFAFGAWMFGLEYLDYPMGNRGMGFGKVRKHLKQHRQTTLGFGFAVSVLSAVPLLNLFIMPVAVAGATALYVEHLQHEIEANY
ncbi:MAG: sulfate transporter CysZ [Gammaproteobacteria bacterium]|nr:sulfate transporter CysZ [Gammaproteobacteria bacterium]